MPISITNQVEYSLEGIREEVRELVCRGIVSRRQPIYILCQHIPARDWVIFENELERCEFLLRDRIGDLLGREDWKND
jgi:Domain of unknown function (DUF4327)